MDKVNIQIFIDEQMFYYIGCDEEGVVYFSKNRKESKTLDSIDCFDEYEKIRAYFGKLNPPKEVELKKKKV